MIKNRTAQLIYQTVYCTLALVGCIACLGIFDDIDLFRWDFYVYFTNISNFLCFGVMLAALIQTAKKKEDGYVTAAPMLKFVGMLGILLTFLVFNIMLAGAEGRDPQLNWRIGSLTFHVVLSHRFRRLSACICDVPLDPRRHLEIRLHHFDPHRNGNFDLPLLLCEP